MDPRKLGGSVAEGSAEAARFRRKRAEARGNVAEGSPKQLAQTLTGVPTEILETDMYIFPRRENTQGKTKPHTTNKRTNNRFNEKEQLEIRNNLLMHNSRNTVSPGPF